MPDGHAPPPLHTHAPQMSHCSLLGLQQLESWELPETAGLPSTSERESVVPEAVGV